MIDTYTEANPTIHRMEMLDVVRFLAALGIVILHVAPVAKETVSLGHFGRFAVPFFTITAVALTVSGFRHNRAKRLGTYSVSRLLRIYLPFLFWTSAYILLRDFKYQFFTHQPLVRLEWPLLIVGSALHLWFLPFILLTTLSAAVAAKGLFRVPAGVVVPISLGAAIVMHLLPHPVVSGVLGDGDGGDGLSIRYFVGLAWQALPMAFVGLAAGCVWEELRSMSWRAPLAWFGLVVMLLALALAPAFDYCLALQDISGIGAVCFALAPWSNRWIGVMAAWGRAAYGIFLVHVFWYLLQSMLLAKLHLPLGVGGVWMLIASTSVLSTITAVLLSHSPFTAWTIGMTSPYRRLN